MLGRQSLDFFPGQRSEYLDVAGCIGIAYVQPELVELIRRCIAGIEPYIAGFRLTEFTAVRLCNQRACQGKYLTAIGTANQFGSMAVR